MCAPFFVFFYYRKRSNVHQAILYVVILVVSWIFVLRPLIVKFHIYFAMSIPLLMIVFSFIARQNKHANRQKRNNSAVIDDF